MSDLYNIGSTAIPDGVHGDGKNRRLRLSVVLWPEPTDVQPPPGTAPLTLLNWTRMIPTLDFSVCFGTDENSLAPIAVTRPEFDPPNVAAATMAKANNVADQWWREMWADPNVRDEFRALMSPSAEAAPKVISYSYAMLAELAHARVATDIQSASLSKRSDLSHVKGRAAARRLDPNDPAVRVSDALDLVELDSFAHLGEGDAYADAIADVGAPGASIDSSLDDAFDKVHAAIDAEISGAGILATSKTDWNPLLPTQNAKGVTPFVAEDALESRFLDPIFGIKRQNVGGGAVGPSPTALGMAAFRRAMKTDAELGGTAYAAAVQSDANRKASNQIAGLQAHPTLRKFVKLIVDIPVPIDDVPAALRAAGKGVVAVKVGNGHGTWTYSQQVLATAFELDESIDLFEPCPEWKFSGSGSRNPSLVPSLPLDQGVVQLNIGRNGGSSSDKRFRLETLDAIAATFSFERGVEMMIVGMSKGATKDEVSTDEASLRTRGLGLLDVEAHVATHIAQKREPPSKTTPPAGAGAPAGTGPGSPKLYFAEDLVDGYRLDIIAPHPILVDGKPRSVFPSGDRRLSYDIIDKAFGSAGPDENPYAAFASRDEGLINAPARTIEVEQTPIQGGAPTTKKQKIQGEPLVTWTGNNAGLPTPWHIKDKQPLLSWVQLPVTTTYNYPTARGPILRVGRAYKVMLRARKINGGSVSPATSERMIKHALGDPASGPFIFGQVERTPRPEVLVPLGQTLIVPQEKDAQPTAYVLNAVEGADVPAVRMLVSPKIGIIAAEQQFQFDPPPTTPGSPVNQVARQQAQRRARQGAYLRLSRDKGQFPLYPLAPGAGASVAHLFKLVLPPPSMKPLPCDPTKPVIPDDNPPYYVDSTLSELGNRLSPTGFTTSFDIDQPSAQGVAFWIPDPSKPHNGFDPEKVVPIRLEVVAGKGSDKSRLLRGLDTKAGEGALAITVPVIRVEVGRADTVELEVWTKRLDDVMALHPAMQRAKARIGALNLPDDQRIAALHEVVRFSISQPVAIPLAEPRSLGIGFVRCKVDQWESSIGQLRDHQLGATSTFAWGKLGFDRKSTKQVWADCRWVDGDPVICLRRKSKAEVADEIENDQLYDYTPQLRRGRLFSLDKIEPLSPNAGENEASFRQRSNSANLALDGANNLRKLTADFSSDRAMRVIYRMVAQSRFAPLSAVGDDLAHSAVSTPDDLFDAYVANGGIRPAGTEELWLPATRPPAAPALSSDFGILYRRRFDRPAGLQGGGPTTVLTHIYRCWLDNRWFDSGPNELLAIICRSASTTPPDWIVPLLSRWGGDMTMRSGRALGRSGDLASFIEPSQFVALNSIDIGAGVPPIPSVLRNVPLPALTGSDAHNVDLALLVPKFHDGAGRWYCDIELKAAPAFKVDLSLSIARYQPHAIDGCHLSKAVTANSVMLHQPWTFSAKRRGADVEVVALGPAYLERAPMTQGLNSRLPGDVSQLAAVPLITAELERVTNGGILPVRSADGTPVVITSKRAVLERSGPDIPDGWSRWTMKISIPPEPIYDDRLAIRVSLSSAHANSVAVGTESPDGGLIHLPEPIVAQLLI